MVEKKRREKFKGGYSKLPFIFNFIFNFILSSILIIFALPVMTVIALTIKIKDGTPVIYKGLRLGIDKKPFIMYKFRTLSREAERMIGAEVLTGQVASKKHLMTPLGKFLRDTRLDELPQLFNIWKGDMDFLGPRPERPEIYEKFCQHIKGYDERFIVKPGLIGYSQLFTPHSSPKRVRTLIDNRLLRKKQNLLWDIGGVLLTILVVVERTIHYGIKLIWNNFIKVKILHSYKEKRRLERVKQDEAVVYIGRKNNGDEVFMYKGKLMNVNEEAILVYSNDEIGQENIILKMKTIYRRLFKKEKSKIALCNGSVYKKISLTDDPYRYAYVIKYTPLSPLNYYMVRQYFLHESVI